VETKAIRYHLDLINSHVHLEPPFEKQQYR
jgi:hypothetical protein